MANVKWHQIRRMLKRTKNKGELIACEVSKKDYELLKWLPQYLFWEDANLINALVLSGADPDKLGLEWSKSEFFCGVPCNYEGGETKAILKNGKKIKINNYDLFFGWMDSWLNPKINW